MNIIIITTDTPPTAAPTRRPISGPIQRRLLSAVSWYCVSLAPQFIRYTVNCTSRDSASHLITHLVVYIIARCSFLNTTTFCLIHVCPVLPHPTYCIADAILTTAEVAFVLDGSFDPSHVSIGIDLFRCVPGAHPSSVPNLIRSI
jgi:hypothetical protein